MPLAKFFDGKSSKAFEVIYDYDIVDHSISFTQNSINQTWLIADCNLEFFAHQLSITRQDSDEQLFINDPIVISEIKNSTSNSIFSFYYQKLVDAGIAIHALIMVGILAIILFVNFVILPEIAENAVNLLPISYDQKLGDTFYDEYLDYSDIDSNRTQQAQLFIDEMQFTSDKRYTVTVVESEMVNAFALPNGAIVVYTGLLDQLESHEEFAALLGHEAAHINLRHSMKMMCRNLSSYLFISAIFSDVNGIISVLAENARQLQSLTYSRSLEEEADQESAKILAQNNIDPIGLKNLFDKLAENSSAYIPEFLSTHPISEKRIEQAEKFIQNERYTITDNAELSRIFSLLKNP